MRNGKHAKITAALVAFCLLLSITAACTKSDDNDAAGSSIKTTAAKTTVKTTTVSGAKSTATTTATATAATTSKPSASSITEAGTADPSEENITESNNQDEESLIDLTTDHGFITDEGFDLKGRTVTVMSQYTWQLPLPDTKDPLWIVVRERIKVAEKKYNFKWEIREPIITSGAIFQQTLISEYMAGIKSADYLGLSSGYAMPGFYNMGILAPLSDYLDYESPLFKVSDHIYKGTYWKGKHYGLRHGLANNTSCMIYYNRQITNREGQPDILDLTESNQWTWAAMESIAINTTKDTNGDGIVDQYGIYTNNNWSLVKFMLYSNGTVGIDFKDGKLRYLMDEPQALRAIQFAVSLAFVHKVYTNVINYWNTGNAAILLTPGLGGNNTYNVQGMESIVSVLPMGPDVNEYQNIGAQNPFGMSALVENKDEMAKLMAELFITWDENGADCDELKQAKEKIAPVEWMWDPANTTTRYYHSEREYWIQKKTALKYIPDYVGGMTGLDSYLNLNLAAPVFTGQKTVSQAVDSIKGYIETTYLDAYN